MAPRNDAVEIRSAWGALRAGGGEEQTDAGWRTIAIREASGWRLLAGVRFPAREESVLVGFRSAKAPAAVSLPRGSGFEVERVTALEAPSGCCLALTRAPAASLDMFAAMVEDVTSALLRAGERDEPDLLQLFLGRIRSWQAFMSAPPTGVLSPEKELGLVGELAVLDGLIAAGISAEHAIAGWEGPLDGLQDFQLGHGAVEAKATLSSSGFPATISCLEQLDTEIVAPVYLAAVRFSLHTEGLSLPDRVKQLRGLAARGRAALDMRLLRAGYSDDDEASYTRRFAVAGTRLIPVDVDFPRLARSALPQAIRSAEYQIDLDLVPTPGVRIEEALKHLGLPYEPR